MCWHPAGQVPRFLNIRRLTFTEADDFPHAWGLDDRSFRIAEAQRLAAVLPDAKVVPIEGSRTFVAEDQPDVLAKLIVEFLEGAAGLGARLR